MKKLRGSTAKCALISLLGCLPVLLQGQSLQVRNAASLTPNTSLAPGAIISIFGTGLANSSASATNAATPPNTLAGVNVTAGGVIAPLFYVSPTQINAVLGASTPLGSQTLTVTSTTGVFTATFVVDKAAPPGIFSLLGTGTHDGAILNAITFKVGAFSTTTAKAPTFLSIFLTGLDLSVAPTVTVGGVPVPVQFYGNAPCCLGLEQVNITIPDSLAGAGRVPVILQSGAKASNAVQIVILPAQGQGSFSGDQENETRSRELAGIAYVPGTSLALATDENDDVVRVLDITQRKVTRTIALPEAAEPVGIAVDGAGKLAVIAERNRAKVAILDLTTFVVPTEIPVGLGPVAVAIAGNQALVVNEDADSVTIIDLTSKSALKTLAVGRGPSGVAIDAVKKKAYVTNQDDGTVSVIDLLALTAGAPLPLGADVRPSAIQLIPGSVFAIIAAPGATKDGAIIVLNLTTGATSSVNANPDRSGGSADIAVNGSTAYFANQAGGSVSVLAISTSTGLAGTPSTVKVDLGARALAIDTKDNLLLVTNQGTGTVVLIDLSNNRVVDRITAVRSDSENDNSEDDHSDHDRASNLPVVTSLTPATTKATITFTLTMTGTGLTGATDVIFVNPADLPGNGKGRGKGKSGDQTHGPFGSRDSAFAASNIQVNANGTQLAATIKVTNAALGPRVVRILTPNGESTFVSATANTLTVVP